MTKPDCTDTFPCSTGGDESDSVSSVEPTDRPTARCQFKDLCLDTADPRGSVAFWSTALGLRVESVRPGVTRLEDAVDTHTLWVNTVPETLSVKNRVHLDVHTDAVPSLLALGARVIDDSFSWTVLADPEGAEFCAFERAATALPDYRLYELVVDAADPETIARWWGDRFGIGARGSTSEGFWWLEGTALPWEMVFVPVPEPKVGKNRVHWDVQGNTEALLAAGATVLRRRDREIGWDVLADPEGNEFCVFGPAR